MEVVEVKSDEIIKQINSIVFNCTLEDGTNRKLTFDYKDGVPNKNYCNLEFINDNTKPAICKLSFNFSAYTLTIEEI